MRDDLGVFVRIKSARETITFFGKMVSGLAAVLILMLTVAGASPAVHGSFHHDADADGHHCAITAFAAGEAYSPLVPVAVAPVVLRVEACVLPTISVGVAKVDYRLRPTCGPPNFSQAI